VQVLIKTVPSIRGTLIADSPTLETADVRACNGS